MLKVYRTYVLAALGVISAAASYLVGDTDLMTAANAAFTAGALAILRPTVPHPSASGSPRPHPPDPPTPRA